MDYTFVEHLDALGVPVKEIPCIRSNGAPTTATEGEVGVLYMDTTTGKMYKCTAVTDGGYTWMPVGGGGAPSDWNAAEGEPGHILNRPFYKGMVELVNGTGVWNDDLSCMIIETDAEFVAGKTYAVAYNGVDYTCTAFAFEDDEMNITVIGNGVDLGFEDTGEPFIMYIMDGMLMCVDYNEATEVTIRIMGEKVFPIPYEYLPPMSCVIDVADGVDKSGTNVSRIIDFDHDGPYDTTELYEALKKGWPIYLDITAMNNGIESRLLVTSWQVVGLPLDKMPASRISVILYAHQYTATTDRMWLLLIN